LALATITTLTPVIVKYVPFIARKASRFAVAEVKWFPSQSVPIRVINGVAYGTFAFQVFNKRYARYHDKYSIPFLDYFKVDPKWKVSDSKYGKIDDKNRLRLELDNIPRGQTILVFVDTEARVNTTDFVVQNCNPPELSHNNYACDVEIINRRDFCVFGFKAQIRVADDNCDNLRIVQNLGERIQIPKEDLTILTITGSTAKIVSWIVDLTEGQIKRYRVTLRGQP
jgi:hypothetical protein